MRAIVSTLSWVDTLRGRFALARRELTAANRKIGDMDMLIAANVLSRGCTLVTNNEKDFKNISGLKIENWT